MKHNTRRCHMKALKWTAISLVMLFVLSPAMLLAQTLTSLTFKWDANTEADLAGYRLYQSTTSSVYVDKPIVIIPVGQTEATIEIEDGAYFWTLTAFDKLNNESGRSNEVAFTADTIPPGIPAGFEIEITVKIRKITN